MSPEVYLERLAALVLEHGPDSGQVRRMILTHRDDVCLRKLGLTLLRVAKGLLAPAAA